jgi:hypothetical protein
VSLSGAVAKKLEQHHEHRDYDEHHDYTLHDTMTLSGMRQGPAGLMSENDTSRCHNASQDCSELSVARHCHQVSAALTSAASTLLLHHTCFRQVSQTTACVLPGDRVNQASVSSEK